MAELGPYQYMMQTLLAERFKLAVHRETKDLPMYALVVATTGSKLRLSEARETFGQNPFRMPGRDHLIGTQVSAEMLVKVLSSQLDRTVQDQTGLKGVFDFNLEWEPDMQATQSCGRGAGDRPRRKHPDRE